LESVSIRSKPSALLDAFNIKMANTVDFLDIGYTSCDYYALAQFPGAFALEWSALDSLSRCVIHRALLFRLYWESIFICAVRLYLRAVPANMEHGCICLGNPVGESPIG